MRHKVNYNPLGRTASHRKALHRNMVTSLFRHERIQTTHAKAKEVRRTAEKMITRAKLDSVHNRRMINRDIKDQEILNKLFVDIGPRYSDRPGGYTRILKLGPRFGDAAEVVILELVKEEVTPKPKKKPKAKKAADSTASKTVKSAPAAEEKAEEAPDEAVSKDAAASDE